jgi:SPP1 family predicted phage head-tail adaptor
VSSGERRDYLRLRTPTTVDDGEGGQTVLWADGPFIWADMRPISAREQALAGAIQTIATHRLSIVYDARITGEGRFSRIAPTGPELQIVGVRDLDGRQRELEVDCAEVV